MFVWLKRHVGWSLFFAAHLGMAALLYQLIPPLPNWSVAVPKGSFGGEVYFVDNNTRVLLANSRDYRTWFISAPISRVLPPYCKVWNFTVDDTLHHSRTVWDSMHCDRSFGVLKSFEMYEAGNGEKVTTIPEVAEWNMRFFTKDLRFALAIVLDCDRDWRRTHPDWPEHPVWYTFDFRRGAAQRVPDKTYEIYFHAMREEVADRIKLDLMWNEIALVDVAANTIVERTGFHHKTKWRNTFNEVGDEGRFCVMCWQQENDGRETRIFDFAKQAVIARWPDTRVTAFCPKRNVVFLMEKKEDIETAFLHDLDTNERRGGWDRVDPAACVFSPDGRWLVLNPTVLMDGDGKDLRVIDVATGRLHGHLPLEQGAFFGFAGKALIVADGKWGSRFNGYDLASKQRTWTHEGTGSFYRWLKTDDGASLIEHLAEKKWLEFRDPASGVVRGRAVCPTSQIGRVYQVVGHHLLATYKRDERNPTWIEKSRRWLTKRLKLDNDQRGHYVAVYDAIHGDELALVPVSSTAEPHLSDDGRWLVCLDTQDGVETMSCWSVRPARPWRWIVGVPAASMAGCLALRGAWRRRRRGKGAT